MTAHAGRGSCVLCNEMCRMMSDGRQQLGKGHNEDMALSLNAYFHSQAARGCVDFQSCWCNNAGKTPIIFLQLQLHLYFYSGISTIKTTHIYKAVSPIGLESMVLNAHSNDTRYCQKLTFNWALV